MFLQQLPSSGISDINSVDSKLLSRREKYRQRIKDNLRNRSRSEYLEQLRQHALKRDVLQKLSVGDVVLEEDINKQRIHWPLAKIIDIFSGRDNVVRLAKVNTDNGIFLRPIQRLFPLEISQSEDDPLPGGDLLLSSLPTLLLDRSDHLRMLLLPMCPGLSE
ncbi:DUF5641 domain-containing protein [Nephila pilipes]|uniref:DUF5641 domain-containing protein n=1 Tax=Nephila pilipes TaxID=299642 RepID=A0A8X6TS56_NEPPI|nr:DUF5641 domain-containing protein [Nephila pilipes]